MLCHMKRGDYLNPKCGEIYSTLKVFALSVSATGEQRSLCLTSLSSSLDGDPSLNDSAGSEGGSIDLLRDTPRHKKIP